MAYYLTETALKDLDEIAGYLAKNFPDKSAITYNLIEEFCDYLDRHPQMGRSKNDSFILEAIMSKLPYRVYYEVKGEDIAILRIYHTARNSLQ